MPILRIQLLDLINGQIITEYEYEFSGNRAMVQAKVPDSKLIMRGTLEPIYNDAPIYNDSPQMDDNWQRRELNRNKGTEGNH